MNMRWRDALPGIPARTPIELGAPSVSQMFTVAQSRGVLDAGAMPYDEPAVTGCASDAATSGTSAAGSWAIAAAGSPDAVGQAYNLCSEGEITQRHLLNALTDALGLPGLPQGDHVGC
jgi:hypothetical protein